MERLHSIYAGISSLGLMKQFNCFDTGLRSKYFDGYCRNDKWYKYDECQKALVKVFLEEAIKEQIREASV